MANLKHKHWIYLAVLLLATLLILQIRNRNTNQSSATSEASPTQEKILLQKPIADSPQSNHPDTKFTAEIFSIPTTWPEALKNAAQVAPNTSKFLQSEVASFEAGEKYTGNFRHFQDLSGSCTRKAQSQSNAHRNSYFHNVTSAHSIAWVEAYLATHCPTFLALRPRLIDWINKGDDDSWVWLDKDLKSMSENWLDNYLNDPDNLNRDLDRKHLFVMQPTYALLKHADNLILYGTNVSQIEIGLRLFGGYDKSLGDPLNVPFETEDYPSVKDRFSKRLMDLTAMVFYCRHRAQECAPQGFYTFVNCQYRYICSEQFSIFRLWAEQYHPNELLFANNFVDAILKRRAELGSRLTRTN